MSSPLNTSLDDATLSSATQLKAASQAMGGSYPTVASALASSDLSPSQVNMVAGFVKGLDTTTLVNLANQSGAQVQLTPQEQDHMAALGELANTAQSTGTSQKPAQGEPRNWLERTFDWVGTHASNTMQTLVDNKPMHYLFEGMNDLTKGVKYPLALLSDALDTGNNDDIDQAMRAEGYDPNSTASYLAFMYNKSDSVFHDLSSVKDQFANGDALVQLAIRQHEDPKQFAEDLAAGKLGNISSNGKTFAAKDLANSADFQKVAALIDQQAISPGRDLAHLITGGHTNNWVFHNLSGVLDATFDIAADPTLIGGKVMAGMKALDYAGHAIEGLNDASRFSRWTGQNVVVNRLVHALDARTGGRFRAGIQNAMDSEGMKALVLSENTKVGQNARGFLQAAADWRGMADKTDEESQKVAAGMLASMQAKYKPWMPFLDEVGGKRIIPHDQLLGTAREASETAADGSKSIVGTPRTPPSIDGVVTDLTGEKHFVTHGDAIEDIHDFANYLGSTQGLLRMGNGIAAKGATLLPGRVSLTARLMARRAAKRAEKGLSKDALDFIIDHSNPGKNLPHEAEESIQSRLDSAYSQDAKTGDALFNSLRKGQADGKGFWNPVKQARMKWDQTARRWSTFMPKTGSMDLNSADATQMVRRVARMYLTRGHADALTSAFANGNTAIRRQVFNSILEQSFHASGLSRSEDGLAFINKYRADQEALDKRAYGLNGTDVIRTPAGDRHVAMFPSQISQNVVIPDFRQLSYVASKSAAAGWMGRSLGLFRSGLQSPTLDALMHAIKMGWITTPAGGARNALDEAAGHIAQNATGNMLKGRSLYTKAAVESKRATEAQRAAAAALKGRLGYRLPGYLHSAAHTVNDVVFGSVIGKLASFTRTGFVTDERELQYARDLIEDEKAGLASEAVTGAHFGEDVAEPLGNEYALELHRNGVAAEQFRLSQQQAKMFQFDGWKQVELDMGAGVDAWVGQMHQAFLDPHSPAHVALRALMEGGDALGDVMAYMRTPQMRHFLHDSEMLNTVPDTERAVQTEAEQDMAIERYAQNMIANVTQMLRGRGRAATDPDLVEQVRNWKATDFRARAASKADEAAAAHPELVDKAEEAQQTADELTRHHTNLAAVHRAHKAHDAATDAVAEAQKRVDDAQAQLDRLKGIAPEVDAREAETAQGQLERAHGEVSRIGERVDKAAARRDNAKKARATTDERKGALQERVKKARADLRRAQAVQEHWEARLRVANGEPAAESAKVFEGEQLDEAERDAQAPWTDEYRSVESLKAERITQADGSQLNQEHVDRLAEEMRAGGYKAPPIQREEMNTAHIVGDGNHRLAAAERAGLTHVPVRTYPNTDEGHLAANRAMAESERAKAEGRQPNHPPFQPTTAKAKTRGEQMVERAQGKVDRQAARAEVRGQKVDDAHADVLLAHHDTGIAHRPSDEEVHTAREAARTARNRASYMRKQVETNARRVQAKTLDADHGFQPDRYGNSQVEDHDVARYLKETGQDPALYDVNQGGAAVVDARIHGGLAEKLLNGEIPSRAWIKQNMGAHELPAHTIKPTFAPINPAQGNAAQNLAKGYTGLLTKAFHQVVEKPVQAVSRNPMRMSAYVQARKTLEPYYKHLVDSGFTEDIAEQTVRRMANTHADQLVIKSIDNATVQTQFEMMARNWWAFVRAQGDWLRRWSRIVKDNPTVIRKAQLMLHAGTSAGMIDQDPQTGQLNFVYPGSGVAINALTKVAKAFGLTNMVNIPVMPDLRSNLTYLNPSADNPAGYSSTPVVSVPFHILSALMGSHHPLLQASADQIVNGQLGAGRAWYANFMPSYVNRIYDGVFKDPNNNPSDAHSQLGSAMHSGLLSMAAAGYLDDPRFEIDPTYRQHFLDVWQQQTKTHMAMRALLGFFLPAPPTSPTEDVQDKNGKWVNSPNFVDHKAGISSLTDEARLVFGSMPYDQASVYWAKYHGTDSPFKQGYDPETQAGSRDAVASAALASASWMQDNPDFVNKYSGPQGLAAYFMPSGKPGTAGGEFSQLAYNAQLEQGMRKYLTTTDQFNNLLVKHAEDFYYTVKKKYDDAVLTATANGDKQAAQAASDEWSQTKDLIYQTNPLLAQKFLGFAANGIMNTQVVNQLNQMLRPENITETTKALGPDQVQGVAQMLLALRQYSSATDSLKGQSSPEATAARAALKAEYDQAITSVTTTLPGLKDLANGAFKTPN